jgi:hypothetical protein
MDNSAEWLEIQSDNDMRKKLDRILIELSNINTRLCKMEEKIEDYENRNKTTDTQISKMLLENREIFTNVMNKFMSLEKDEIQPMLAEINNNHKKIVSEPIKSVLEYNRQWRIYSNNFRQNIVSNNTNILTQMALNTKDTID